MLDFRKFEDFQCFLTQDVSGVTSFRVFGVVLSFSSFRAGFQESRVSECTRFSFFGGRFLEFHHSVVSEVIDCWQIFRKIVACPKSTEFAGKSSMLGNLC